MANRKGSVALVAIVVLAGVGWYGWSRTDIARSSSELEREVAAAQAAGLPLSTADLRRAIEIRTAGGNAGPFYQDAFALGLGKGKGLRNVFPKLIQGTATPADRALVKRELAALRPALARMEQGARQPHLNYDRRWEQGMSLLLPDLSEIRKLSDALAVRALLEAEAGDEEAAKRSLTTAARVAAHLHDDPTLISLLTRAANERRILRTAMRIVQIRQGDNVSRNLVRATLKELGPIPDLRLTFGAEVVFSRLVISDIGGAPSKDILSLMQSDSNAMPTLAGPALRLNSVRRANETMLLRFWRELYQSIPENPDDYRGLRNAMKAVQGRYAEKSGMTYTLFNILAPSLDTTISAVGQMHAGRRVAATGIDLLDARDRTGNWPMASAVDDPFGNRLRIRLAGPGAVVYSVGDDGRDDGGKEAAEDRGVGTDLAFRLPAPARGHR